MNFLYELWDQVLKAPVFTILSGVLGTYAAIIAHKISTWFNLKNEDELRAALHSSADNAVNYASNFLGGSIASIVAKGMVDSLIGEAMSYVKKKNKGTLKKLDVTDSALEDIIRSKVGKKQNEKAAVPVKLVEPAPATPTGL